MFLLKNIYITGTDDLRTNVSEVSALEKTW